MPAIRYHALIYLLLFAFSAAYAQQTDENLITQRPEPAEESRFMDKVVFGGSFGLWFGNDFGYVEVSPSAAYRATDKLMLGAGIRYQYLYQKYRYVSGEQFTNHDHLYGGRIFASQMLYGPLFAHAEFEAINWEVFQVRDQNFNREWVPDLFLGGGINQPVGRTGGVSIMLLYNVLHDEQRSPYNDAIIYRMSFFF